MSYGERITRADLDAALAAHVDALAAVGIEYEGHLGYDIGSRTYGRAYRLFRTGETREDGSKCSGHSNPPVGSDYLGMTARDAYENLTGRTRVLYDVAHALRLPRKGETDTAEDIES